MRPHQRKSKIEDLPSAFLQTSQVYPHYSVFDSIVTIHTTRHESIKHIHTSLSSLFDTQKRILFQQTVCNWPIFMLQQKPSLRHYKNSEEVKSVARKLHRIKRRLLKDLATGGSTENYWNAHDEALHPSKCTCCNSCNKCCDGWVRINGWSSTDACMRTCMHAVCLWGCWS